MSGIAVNDTIYCISEISTTASIRRKFLVSHLMFVGIHIVQRKLIQE